MSDAKEVNISHIKAGIEKLVAEPDCRDRSWASDCLKQALGALSELRETRTRLVGKSAEVRSLHESVDTVCAENAKLRQSIDDALLVMANGGDARKLLTEAMKSPEKK